MRFTMSTFLPCFFHRKKGVIFPGFSKKSQLNIKLGLLRMCC